MDERDPSVVARARDGDRDAFRALVERHSRYIFSLAHRMTGNAQDAEDVVQEAWLKAHKQLSRFEARADFRTWMHRITVNCSIDLIRARRHREDAHDPMDLEQGPLSERGADTQATPDPADDPCRRRGYPDPVSCQRRAAGLGVQGTGGRLRTGGAGAGFARRPAACPRG